MRTVFSKDQTIIIKEDSSKVIDNSAVGTPLNNPLEELFCQYYCTTLNASDSMLNARNKLEYKEITSKSISTIAGEFLNKVEIQQRIAELMQNTKQKLQINQTRILEGIQHELDQNIADVFYWKDGNLVLKDLDLIPIHIQKTIKKIKQTKEGIEVEFYDKQRAREQMMKFLGMLNDKVDLSVKLDLGNRLAEAHQRYLAHRGKGGISEPEIQDVDFEEV